MPGPRKILVIKLRELAHTVMMTAPLLELRRAYPNAEIHVLVNAQWAPVLENHPAVDRILTYERRRESASRARALARIALELRKERYDWVINLHARPSSSTLSFATGAKTRSIHFYDPKTRSPYSTVEIPGRGVTKNVIDRDMDALRAVGINASAVRLPQLRLREDEKKDAAAFLKKLDLGEPVLALGLGASRLSKVWPVDRFAGLAIAWAQQTGGGVLAFASLEQASLCKEFSKAVDDLLTVMVRSDNERSAIRSKVVCETAMPIRQIAATFAHCAAYQGNDNGLKHLAVAAGIPTVTVFGPDSPLERHPYSEEKHPYCSIEAGVNQVLELLRKVVAPQDERAAAPRAEAGRR